MPVTLNATTTNGLVTSADNSGSLQLQTNNGTTAVTIDTSQNVGVGTTTPNANGKLTVSGNIVFPSAGNGLVDDFGNQIIQRISGGNIDIGNAGWNNIRLYTQSTERMRIDSSGRVTMPAQPCFHARLNGNSYITTSPIPFSNAPINVGSSFNTSTYRFTAPVSGKYYFILMLYVRIIGNGDVTCYVRVNDSNRQYLNYIVGSSTTQYNSITMPSIFNLSAGDYVDYTFSGSNGTYYNGNQETNLFGWLLG